MCCEPRFHMNIALLESDIIWEQPQANYRGYEAQMDALSSDVDIIVLPEFFTLGFSMHTALAEPAKGQGFAWMQAQAAARGAALAGSLMVREGEGVYNRFYFVCPDGSHFQYDKRHLFRCGEEHLHMKAGQDRPVFAYKGWNICLQICYDLRFPVWSRNRNLEYDLLLYVANFPSARQAVLDPLLRARAIENLAYVGFVNRIGSDGMGLHYEGGSCLIDYKGQKAEGGPVYGLSLEALREFRQKFPAYMDADEFYFSDDSIH